MIKRGSKGLSCVSSLFASVVNHFDTGTHHFDSSYHILVYDDHLKTIDARMALIPFSYYLPAKFLIVFTSSYAGVFGEDLVYTRLACAPVHLRIGAYREREQAR